MSEQQIQEACFQQAVEPRQFPIQEQVMQGPPIMQTMGGPIQQHAQSRNIGPYVVTGWEAHMKEEVDEDGNWVVFLPDYSTMGGYKRHTFNSEKKAKKFLEKHINKTDNK